MIGRSRVPAPPARIRALHRRSIVGGDAEHARVDATSGWTGPPLGSIVHGHGYHSVRRRIRRIGVASLLVFAVVAAAPSTLGAGAATSPSHWDPQIAPIAKEVETLRHLKFEHPVGVRFLSRVQRSPSSSAPIGPSSRRRTRPSCRGPRASSAPWD